MSPPLALRIDALHVTPPSEFVAARNALARELAAAHDPGAASVKALPRPTLAVWAINLAARAPAGEITALLGAGENVLRAHRLVLGGAAGEALLGANREMNAALERAVGSAALLAEKGSHPLARAMLGRVRATLRALALGSPEERERLRAGRVLAESSDTGLASLEALSALRPPTPPAAPRRSPGEDRRAARERSLALAAARKKAEHAAVSLAKLEALAGRVRAEADEAQRAAEEARVRLRGAEERIQEARRLLEEARRAAAGLESEA